MFFLYFPPDVHEMFEHLLDLFRVFRLVSQC